MSKLANLKKWLTVPDAVRKLSREYDKEVSEADILQYALDGHLQLSVNFVNTVQARPGNVAQYTEAELAAAVKSGDLPGDLKWKKMPKDLHAALKGEPIKEEVWHLMSLRIGENRYLTLTDEVVTLTGVWDLPMIGAEKLDIAHAYQRLTDGPPVTLSNLDGTFVEGRDGQICQLLTDYDDNFYQAGSRAQLEKIKQYIAKDKIKPKKAKALLQEHEEARKTFLEGRKSSLELEKYFPAGGLPEDSVIVVRTEALRLFQQTISGEAEKPLAPNERNSLLTIIAALCDYSDINCSKHGAAAQIAKLTEEIGAAISDDTVRRVLGKIPDALEARKK
ncbi:hypothetical protein Q8A64_01070 [Oxalobacteraceae bacterium R-40]|uniref:Uncharacterized protein n=1 Tax=Keguizhuia sedimenti TaxID=3064264 RepID=A0ABU1BKN2_9BURK|nr:hypothetical protein [Oxalobacteraceae bacterium R-40]